MFDNRLEPRVETAVQDLRSHVCSQEAPVGVQCKVPEWVIPELSGQRLVRTVP